MRRTLLVAPLALALAACSGGEGGASNRRALVDSRDTYDPRSLDPAKSTDVPTGRAVAYLFDGLMRFDADATVHPGLAERFELSADGLTYTFHLRRNVQFHDGTPLVARQVVRSFQRVLDPRERGGRGWPLYPIAGAREFADGKSPTVTGLSAPDDSTVVVRLAEPLAVFPKLLAMPVTAIVPDSTPVDFGEKPVGTGPWKLVEWKHDDYIKLARNERYWGGAPRSDTLVARIIPEPSTAAAEFEAGNVDVLQVPETDTRTWEKTDDRQAVLQSAPALRLFYLAMNTTRGPLADARVRQAVNHAVDVSGILRQVIGGRGTRAAGVIPPSLAGVDTARAPYAFDPAKARQLLAAAGHPNGIDVELWVSQDATFSRLAQTVQSYLQQAGIRAKLVQRDASSVREASRAGQVDMHLKDWWADYPDAENFLYPLLHSANRGVGGNVSFYANPEFDRVVTAARREQNDAARVALYRQADSLAFADAPMLFLFFYDELYAVQPGCRASRRPRSSTASAGPRRR
jgi:peptide/nickel transport system substrate-binding protein/oligopeptide transport system substrate-binding protein